MVCSYPDWTDRYLGRLRGKFLEQEYPEEMIDEGFAKAKKQNRMDLITKKKDLKKNQKNRNRMRNCLCVTLNPANPPFHRWIKELLPILHRDEILKKLVPSIPVVSRQPPRVANLAIKSKHWKKSNLQKCVCCSRMEQHTPGFRSSNTGRQYSITRKYNCLSSWVVYLVTCDACNMQYVGQTTQEMRRRHYGHRSDVRNGIAGLGSHFRDVHGQGLDLKSDDNLNTCMANFRLVVVASVRPPTSPEEEISCQEHLDRIEADLQTRLRCMSENGGMNVRDEDRRRRNR